MIKKYTKTISFTVTQEDLERIDYIKAYEEEFNECKLTRSDAIRIAIQQYSYHNMYEEYKKQKNL